MMASIIARLKNDWQLLVNAGAEKCADRRQAKYHRIANRLLLAIVFINLWLNVLEITGYLLLINRDFAAYRHYFVAYTLPSTVLYLATGLTYHLKNRTGNMSYALLIVPVVVAYIALLAIYLGKPMMIHVFIFALFPIPFFIHGTKEWRMVIIHELVILSGLAAVFWGYERFAPPYPLPVDFETPFFVAAMLTAVLVMVLSAYVMWRQSCHAEDQLEIEKNHVETLLEETIPKLARAEEKYRHLVEGTGDIIFSMTTDGRFITLNKAVRGHLGFSPDELANRSIFELLPQYDSAGYALEKELLQESIRNLLEKRTPVKTRVSFAGKYAKEPVEFSLRLEYPETEGEAEILGKAVSVEDDLILNFLHRERGSYSIGNLISHADVLSQKLTRNLTRIMPVPDVQSIRLSLREMLINAIEHGNLDITFDEKTQVQANGDFLEFLASRRSQPEYAGRRVRIDYIMDMHRVAYRIRDEGRGFDHAALMEKAADIANEGFLEHGRGIVMTRSLFDVVRYNDTGNEVVLIKYTVNGRDGVAADAGQSENGAEKRFSAATPLA